MPYYLDIDQTETVIETPMKSGGTKRHQIAVHGKWTMEQVQGAVCKCIATEGRYTKSGVQRMLDLETIIRGNPHA